MKKTNSKALFLSLIFSLIFFLVLILPINGAELEWYTNLKQIQLLVTTRQEAERIFNHPKYTETSKEGWSQKVFYDLEEGSLHVSYSTGRCSQDRNTAGYNVENGVIIGVYFYLKKLVNIAKLGLDLSDFKRTKVFDTDAWIYSNEDLGVKYSGTKTKIRSFEFSPSEQHEHLDCENVLNNK